MRLQAYEGQEPFVFVSYAHKDTDKVMRVLTELDRRGYRIWYDDGIVPGSEWPENIAEHLTDSAMVLAFISQNSIDSPNCRREITFALSKRKPFLSVVLERAEMSPGMEMQLTAQQSVIRNNYEDETAFINKICSCPDLKPCLKEPRTIDKPAADAKKAEVPQPAPQKETETVQAAAVPTVQTQAKPSSESAGRPTKTDKPARTDKSGKKAAAKRQPAADGTKKKRLGRILGIPIGAVLLVFIIILVSSRIHANKKTPQIAVTDTVSVNETSSSVKLADVTITGDIVSRLKKLEKLTSLNLEKCSFADGALQELTALPLKKLGLADAAGISDFTFLDGFADLTDISLIRCGVTDQNFTLAAGGKLTSVNLSGNPAFTDLKLINYTSLATLNIDETGVTDISVLSGAEKLAYFYASGTGITDVSPLASLQGLKVLCLNRTGVKTIDTEFQSLRLQTLQLADCGITSLEGFVNLTVLQEADLSGNQLTDISWLYKSASTLKTVRLAGNPLTDRLQQLSECTKMQLLDISGIPVHTMYFAKDMTELTGLYAENCQLTAIEELAGKTNLRTVDLSDNMITDYSTLSQIDASVGSIDLSNNEITSLSPIAKIRRLNLTGNPISYAAVPENFNVQFLYCDYNTDLPGSGLVDKVSVRLGVLNVPADKQVELERVSGRIRIMTEEEVQEAME